MVGQFRAIRNRPFACMLARTATHSVYEGSTRVSYEGSIRVSIPHTKFGV